MRVDWCHVPAGEVVRGTRVEDLAVLARGLADLGVQPSWLAKETPQHTERVGEFWMARTPVTVTDWREFRLGSGPGSGSGGVGDGGVGDGGRGDLPVTGVGWDDAAAFCAWATDSLGVAVRLPTELQWERAARGDDAREFPWGDVFAPDRANLREHGVGGPIPVGSLPLGAGPFGTLDLAGNVDEWTSTVYAPYPGAPDVVPQVEDWAFDRHVTRGGSWFHSRDLARCARRHGAYDADLRGVGLRLVALPAATDVLARS